MRLPYTVGLVLTGIGLAVAGLETGAMLTHDFIFEVILPPLLFEAALSIRWRELRQDMLPVVVLSTLGVVISAVVVAAGMVKFLAWPAAPALVFGVLIAATDPIAVLAMFKDTRAGSGSWWRVKAFSMTVLQRCCLRAFLLGHRRPTVRS
jgi:CPA1 family monovalent cation:H+ antiporter